MRSTNEIIIALNECEHVEYEELRMACLVLNSLGFLSAGGDIMKICNATGNGVCVNCNRIPPKINGWSYGNICRMDVEDILAALEYGNLVCYNTDNGKFYEKTMYEHPRDFINDDWMCID